MMPILSTRVDDPLIQILFGLSGRDEPDQQIEGLPGRTGEQGVCRETDRLEQLDGQGLFGLVKRPGRVVERVDRERRDRDLGQTKIRDIVADGDPVALDTVRLEIERRISSGRGTPKNSSVRMKRVRGYPKMDLRRALDISIPLMKVMSERIDRPHRGFERCTTNIQDPLSFKKVFIHLLEKREKMFMVLDEKKKKRENS